jgi:hypothetical protein
VQIGPDPIVKRRKDRRRGIVNSDHMARDRKHLGDTVTHETAADDRDIGARGTH